MKLIVFFILLLLALFITGTAKAYQNEGFSATVVLMASGSIFLIVSLILAIV